MPPSFADASGSICYTLKVTVSYVEPGRLLRSNREVAAPVTVLMPRAEADRLTRSDKARPQLQRSEPTQTRCGYDVRLSTRVLRPGDALVVDVCVFGLPKNTNVRILSASLRAVRLFFGPDNKNHQVRLPRPMDESSELFSSASGAASSGSFFSTSGNAPGGGELTRRFTMVVDRAVAPPSMESPLISVRSFFRLEVVLDNTETPNVLADFPVIILPPEDDGDDDSDDESDASVSDEDDRDRRAVFGDEGGFGGVAYYGGEGADAYDGLPPSPMSAGLDTFVDYGSVAESIDSSDYYLYGTLPLATGSTSAVVRAPTTIGTGAAPRIAGTLRSPPLPQTRSGPQTAAAAAAGAASAGHPLTPTASYDSGLGRGGITGYYSPPVSAGTSSGAAYSPHPALQTPTTPPAYPPTPTGGPRSPGVIAQSYAPAARTPPAVASAPPPMPPLPTRTGSLMGATAAAAGTPTRSDDGAAAAVAAGLPSRPTVASTARSGVGGGDGGKYDSSAPLPATAVRNWLVQVGAPHLQPAASSPAAAATPTSYYAPYAAGTAAVTGSGGAGAGYDPPPRRSLDGMLPATSASGAFASRAPAHARSAVDLQEAYAPLAAALRAQQHHQQQQQQQQQQYYSPVSPVAATQHPVQAGAAAAEAAAAARARVASGAPSVASTALDKMDALLDEISATHQRLTPSIGSIAPRPAPAEFATYAVAAKPPHPNTSTTPATTTAATFTYTHSAAVSTPDAPAPAPAPPPRYRAIAAFAPRLADELALGVGDVVVVSRAFGDGWAAGENLHSAARGVFPLQNVELF
ncbi:hypothetical protein HK405_010033 [Cladochytrium tenue]|nr:hypothetical protein HK405_010033 [Cladochytrium tenue]